jgi:hypothetical protein
VSILFQCRVWCCSGDYLSPILQCDCLRVQSLLLMLQSRSGEILHGILLDSYLDLFIYKKIFLTIIDDLVTHSTLTATAATTTTTTSTTTTTTAAAAAATICVPLTDTTPLTFNSTDYPASMSPLTAPYLVIR